MSNLESSPISINPILDLQNISKEFSDPNRNDTPIHVVIDKFNSKGKKGELVTYIDPFGYEKSAFTK